MRSGGDADGNGAASKGPQGRVTIDGARPVDLVLGAPLRFGRCGRGDDTVGLDPMDDGISMDAGQIVLDRSSWTLTNRSKKRAVYVEQPTVVRWHHVVPGESFTSERGATVLVPGKIFTHALVVEVENLDPRPMIESSQPLGAAPTQQTELSPGDRLALVALFEGYLHRWPRHDPHPATYEAAAAKLGWASTRLRRRVEHLRERLEDQGVPDLNGTNALRALADHVFGTGVLGVADLAVLDDHRRVGVLDE